MKAWTFTPLLFFFSFLSPLFSEVCFFWALFYYFLCLSFLKIPPWSSIICCKVLKRIPPVYKHFSKIPRFFFVGMHSLALTNIMGRETVENWSKYHEWRLKVRVVCTIKGDSKISHRTFKIHCPHPPLHRDSLNLKNEPRLFCVNFSFKIKSQKKRSATFSLWDKKGLFKRCLPTPSPPCL